MAEEIREAIERLNGMLGEMPYKLAFAAPGEIKLLEKNARYMSEDMFRNLVENVKRDGALSSLPLCYREEDGGLLVLSGNHRVQAAIQAGLDGIMVLVIERAMSREERVAVQLSHNAIEGKDDQVILKSLWDEIEDIELKLYAGLDAETLAELARVEYVQIAEARVDYRQVTLAFLPEEADALRQVLAEADTYFGADETYVLARKDYDEVFGVLADIKERYGIVNNPTAMMKLVELARAGLG